MNRINNNINKNGFLCVRMCAENPINKKPLDVKPLEQSTIRHTPRNQLLKVLGIQTIIRLKRFLWMIQIN